jgi:hypothetical protein
LPRRKSLSCSADISRRTTGETALGTAQPDAWVANATVRQIKHERPERPKIVLERQPKRQDQSWPVSGSPSIAFVSGLKQRKEERLAVEACAAKQEDKPTLSIAIRRLLAKALGKK